MSERGAPDHPAAEVEVEVDTTVFTVYGCRTVIHRDGTFTCFADPAEAARCALAVPEGADCRVGMCAGNGAHIREPNVGPPSPVTPVPRDKPAGDDQPVARGKGAQQLFDLYRNVQCDIARALGSASALGDDDGYSVVHYLMLRRRLACYEDRRVFGLPAAVQRRLVEAVRELGGRPAVEDYVERRRLFREDVHMVADPGPTLAEWFEEEVWCSWWAAVLAKAGKSLRHNGAAKVEMQIGVDGMIEVPLDPTVFSAMTRPPRSDRHLTEWLVLHHLSRCETALDAIICGAVTMGLDDPDCADDEPDYIRAMLHEMFVLSLEDRLEDYWKWCLASMAYERLDDFGESPPPPPPWCNTGNCPFRGRLRGWWIRQGRLHDKGTAAYLSLCNWLLQSKKCFPQISAIKVAQSVAGWYRAFTEPPAPPAADPAFEPGCRPGEDRLTDRLTGEIRRSLRELYRAALGVRKAHHAPRTRLVPLPAAGTKATIESDRSEGGTWNELHKCLAEGHVVLEELTAPVREFAAAAAEGPEKNAAVNWLFRASSHEHTVATFHSLAGDHVYEVRGLTPPGYWLPIVTKVANEVENLLRLVPVGLPEPFKVRVISKGRAVTYWLSRLVQKHMHRALTRLPEFELIGLDSSRTIADVLDDVIGPVPLSRDGYVMVSGDYKASTDSLREKASRMAVELWCETAGYTPAVSTLVMATMCDNLIMRHGADRTPQPQVSAQPMGSPVSFPFLCALNWAASVVGLRRVEHGGGAYGWRKVGRSGIVINGDDILFAATKAGADSWSYCTGAIGLSPSVGKNYLSWHFGNVNSAMFKQVSVPAESSCVGHYRPVGAPPVRWHFVPYVNVSVLRPQPRPSPDEFLVMAPALQQIWLNGWGEYNAGQCARPEQCFKRLWDAVTAEQQWLHEWSKELAHVPAGVNWFIPRDLGGLGLWTRLPLARYDDDFVGPRFERYVDVTPAQQRVASFLRDSTEPTTLHRHLPRFGSPESDITVHQDGRRLYEELSRLGLINEVFLPPGERSLTIGGVAQVLTLSGYSSGLGVSRLTRVAGVWREVAPTPAKGARNRGRSRFVRAWSRAARSTGREMEIDDMVTWEPRQIGWRLNPGYVFNDLPLSVRPDRACSDDAWPEGTPPDGPYADDYPLRVLRFERPLGLLGDVERDGTGMAIDPAYRRPHQMDWVPRWPDDGAGGGGAAGHYYEEPDRGQIEYDDGPNPDDYDPDWRNTVEPAEAEDMY